jgi:hypothetical protein
VLEAGKTMVQTCEEFFKKMAERQALKHARNQAASEILP